MDYESVVNDLHPDQCLSCESHLALETIDQRGIKLINEDATEIRVGVQHDNLVAKAGDHDLVFLSA